MPRLTSRLGWLLLAGPWPATAVAEPSVPSEADVISVRASSETTLRLFQRSSLPGPGGTLVRTETALPVYEHFALRVDGVDHLGELDSLSMEFSGWMALDLVQREDRSLVDGDVGSANATQRLGPAEVRLGRQYQAGGAARYSRFDGASVGVDLGSWGGHRGGLTGYGGFLVLPRWNERPGYHHLGAAADTLLREPNAYPEPERTGYVLGGVRARYGHGRALDLGLSFHEQRRAGELDRRNGGVDARLGLGRDAVLAGDAVFDLDGVALADARAWLDLRPAPEWTGSVEYLHVQPDLLLSRQSVLSVFSTEAFDEIGVELGHTPVRHLTLAPYGYVQSFPESEWGARGGVRLDLDLDGGRTRWVSGYGRVVLQEGGYHALRQALSRRLSWAWTLYGEVYHYAYDRPIDGHRGSSVYALHCSWAAHRNVSLLWGASLASTPYAESDAQTLLRLRWSDVFGGEGTPP